MLLTLFIGLCTSGVSRADTIQYRVSFNNPNAFQFASGSTPYALDFFLSAGSGTTSVSGSNFSGSGTSSPATNFSLDNSTSEAETTRAFSPSTTSPASSLSFDILATYTPGSTDTFSFGIFKNFGRTDVNGDPTQTLIRTTEPAPLEQSFFTIDFSSLSGPVARSYGSNEPGFNIGAPTITATPEPETWAMMMLGLVALGIADWKRRQKDQPALTA